MGTFLISPRSGQKGTHLFEVCPLLLGNEECPHFRVFPSPAPLIQCGANMFGSTLCPETGGCQPLVRRMMLSGIIASSQPVDGSPPIRSTVSRNEGTIHSRCRFDPSSQTTLSANLPS